MNRQQQIDHFLARAHVLALSRLREEPGRITEVRNQLAHWRNRAGPIRSDDCWDEWERLLSGPFHQLEVELSGSTDHATQLRSMSPMSVLITQAERTQLLAKARQAA
jgi:hypothetical protein